MKFVSIPGRLNLLACSLLCLSLLACASKVRLDTDLPPADDKTIKTDTGTGNNTGNGSTNTGTGTGAGGVKLVDVGTTTVDTQMAGLLAKRSIYFDFDSDTVREEFKPTLEAHAKNLKANANLRVVLEGNTDDKGGREYNLALGQKRANAVIAAFRVLGVTDKQMEAVSFGKEKPKALGNDEAAAYENRRADISYR